MITVRSMIIIAEKDYYSTNKPSLMKKVTVFLFLSLAILTLTISCKNSRERKSHAVVGEAQADSASIMLIGKDIITDIVLKPDTLGDPWEVEKVKGFSGDRMLRKLLENIYSEKVTAWDCRYEETLQPAAIKDLEKKFGSDLSRIGKVQFVEDWYFDTNKNIIVKKVKSVAFGYSTPGSDETPLRYNAFFRIKAN
jgi:hypothetical protein